MADNKLYKVAITLGGNYTHGQWYDKLTQVYYAEEDGGDGCSYISKKPNQNIRPGTDDTVWQIASARGKQGNPGQPGADGAPGTPGRDGVDGQPGERGPAGITEVHVSVTNSSGTPDVDWSLVGGVLNMAFSGLKGEPGANGTDGTNGVDGVGFASVSNPVTPDGTVLITLTNGDTITLDLNHNHPQYPKYVLCEDESEMPVSPENDTLYLILE